MSVSCSVAPDNMNTPADIELKTSGVDPNKTGIWASIRISEGSKYGPFEGKKVQDASDNMDSAFVWEIVDLESKEFLFYIDATEGQVGNWMKFIGCARYFEEQNIVSQQEGTEIFYKAIKDIEPGEELLTWYEKIPMRKKRGRKKKSTGEDASSRSSTPTVDIYSKRYKANPKRKVPENAESDDDQAKRPKRIQKKSSKYSEFTDSEYISDGYISASSDELRAKSASPVHKKKKVNPKVCTPVKKTSKSKENSDVDEEDDKAVAEDEEDEVFEDDDMDSVSVCSSSLKLDQDGAVIGSSSRTSSVAEPDKYQFDLKAHHVVKSRLGRKVFQCDICMAIYRHAFSLKRHYIRTHINYNYVTKGDLQNCQITGEALETLAMARSLQKKQLEQVKLAKDATNSDKAEAEQKISSTESEASQADDAKGTAETANLKENQKTSDPLLSPGKDENRNKISDGAIIDKENEVAERIVVEEEQTNSKGIEQAISEGASGKQANNDTIEQVNSEVASDKTCELDGAEALLEPKAVDSNSCLVSEVNGLSENLSAHNQKSSAENVTDVKSSTVENKSNNAVENADQNCVGGLASENTEAVTENKIEAGNDNGMDQSEKNLQELSEAKTTDGDNTKETTDEVAPETTESCEGKAGDDDDEKISPQFSALFRCNVCNFCFDTTKQLKSHIEDHPDMPNMKAFGCDKCDMRFSHKQNLVRHQAVHTGAKPFTCRYCGKNFPTVTNQKRHERIHLGRRVQCEYCASSFTQSGDLKKHTRKLHPEHFHECAFCAKYFSSQQELIGHLDTHNENFASNKEEENRRRVDMEKDREESMRLAECKPGYKFACTVCKKRFHDYANMCRHRRLAHQRHLLISKKVRMCNNIDGHMDSGKSISDSVLFDLEPNSYFYNNVARNISENLKYFVEGGMNDMQNNAAYIRWKSEEQNSQVGSSKPSNGTNVKSTPTVQNTKDLPHEDTFTKYNFPAGFKLKDHYTEVVGTDKEHNVDKRPNGNSFSSHDRSAHHGSVMLSVPTPRVLPPVPKPQSSLPNGLFRPYSDLEDPVAAAPPSDPSKRTFDSFQISSGTVSQLEGLPEPQTAPYNFSTKPDGDKTEEAQNAAQKTVLPIKTPSIKICAVCRSIFSNEEMYVKHMMDKHKITVESSPTSLKENVPVLAAHSVPPVINEVTVSSSHMSPPGVGVNPGSRSPRTCLNIPQVFKSSKKFSAFKNGHQSDVDAGAMDLSPTASQKQLTAGPVLNLTKSVDNLSAGDSLDLTCKESVMESPKAKSNKSPKGKSQPPVNRVVLQTPKIVPRFESPFHKTGRKSHSQSSISNGITVPYFPPPVLDLTKNADTSGLGSYQEMDMCARAGVVDYTLKQETENSNCTTPCEEMTQTEKSFTTATNVASKPEQVVKSWPYRPCYNPSPVGLLNVCTSQVPSQPEKMRYNCTKCSKKFSVISSLHAHILECASEGKSKKDSTERMQPKYVFKKGLGRISIQSKKIPSAGQLKLKAAIGFQNKMFLGKKKSSAFFTGKDEEYYNGDSAANKRRRNFELMYNPQNHMRRRELTEVLDMHRCHGCGLRFGTISLLERHIRVCKHKEKIKEMHLNKTTVTSRRVHKRPKESFVQDAHKQKCRYCDKLFTYIGMLKKHILDICPVRREYFVHGNEDHIDKEWEETIMCIGGGGVGGGFLVNTNVTNNKESVSPDNMSDASESSKAGRKRKGRGRRKNRKWGNQNKSRRRSPDNCKNDEDSMDDEPSPPKSPDSAQISDDNAPKEEDGNYSDDTDGSGGEVQLGGTEPEEVAPESKEISFNNSSTIVSESRTLDKVVDTDDNKASVERLETPKDVKNIESQSVAQNPNVLTSEIKENINSTVTLGVDIKLDGEAQADNTLAKEIASVSGKPAERALVEDKAAHDKKENTLTSASATKSLFDLDSTIARLKERTNAASTFEQVESEQQDSSPETKTTKVKIPKKKKTISLDKNPNPVKSKQPKQKLPKTTDPSLTGNKKKKNKKEPKLTDESPVSTDTADVPAKTGAKRGRKPKVVVAKPLPSSTEKLENAETNIKTSPPPDELKSSETVSENAEVSQITENKTESGISEGPKSKKAPKGRGKGKKKKTDIPVVGSSVDDLPNVDNTAEDSVESFETSKSNPGETVKSKKGGRKKKSDIDVQKLNVSNNDAIDGKTIDVVQNGILGNESVPIPPKSKRGSKKRKIVDEIDNMTDDAKIPKIVDERIISSKLDQAMNSVEDPIANGETDVLSETKPIKRGRKPGKKATPGATSNSQNVSVMNSEIVRKKPGPKKKFPQTEGKDLLAPDKNSIRSSSRSASRSTSRSRSTSVQRELTPPPAKKARATSSAKVSNDGVHDSPQGRGKRIPNSKTTAGTKANVSPGDKKKTPGLTNVIKVNKGRGKANKKK